MEYRSEIRRNKILVHETATWRLRSLLLRTEAWKRRSGYRMYDCIYTHVRKGKTVGTEPGSVVAQGWEEQPACGRARGNRLCAQSRLIPPSQTEGPFTKGIKWNAWFRTQTLRGQSYTTSSWGATGQPKGALFGVRDVPWCLGGNCTSNQECEIIKLCLCYNHGSPQKHSSQFLLSEAGEITEAAKGHIEVTENLGEFTYWSLSTFFRRQ